ncbi:hypothetical protein D1B33_07355 [Lysinibacillus yapensis]|uniref:Uncharacterized protein n=2 Tax=Ureibacillus yapensis TaxID=2304605 RepID=A0A396SC66_9BACL|nr:hypothetical protein D1B33_07355 [Lysinibacillus yapensis]
MKVYLWPHKDGIFLVNEDFTMISKPYFITHPQRTSLLKDRFNATISREELLSTITDEELQSLVNNSVLRWKSIIPLLPGFEEEFIAQAEI